MNAARVANQFCRMLAAIYPSPRAIMIGILLCGLVSGASRQIDTIQISGHEYVKLSDWPAAAHLELHWLRRDETLQARNRDTNLVFNVDSAEAQINGVQVRLLFPAAARNGSLYVSQLDLRCTILPVLVPPRDKAGASITSICLDPGHGGKDAGNHAGSRLEKKYTLLLAEELSHQLAEAGFKVSMTRTRDEFVELGDRPETANNRRSDLFLSLHFNSTEGARNTVRGAEVYCLTPAGAPSSNSGGEGSGSSACVGNRCNERNMFLAYQLQKALVRDLGVEDRGVHRARFAVLRDATMPAVLVEAGFMSHPEEGKKIFDAGYRKQIAKGIVQGVLAYKRAVSRPAT